MPEGDTIHNAARRVTVAPGITHFTPEAVGFTDGTTRRFAAVILATGFRPALDYLAAYLTPPDEKQAHLPIQPVPTLPDLYVVGQYYDGLRGALYLIGRQAQEVARRIRHSPAAHVPDSWVTASTSTE